MPVSPRIAATLIVGTSLLLAATTCVVYREWRSHRLLALNEGMSQQEVRRAVGDPDFEAPAGHTIFTCTAPNAKTVWTYRIAENSSVELVFDQDDKLICKEEYFIVV